MSGKIMLGKTICAFVVSWYYLPWIEQYVDDHLGYWPLILRFEFSRHVYHLCFVYVESKLEADVSIHFSLQPEFISLLMVAINSLPRQDSTWIKVTIKEKCRVVFYDQTSSDLIHLKRLKRMNTKTAPPHTHNLYKSIQHLHFIFESALQKMAFWGRKGRSFKKRLLG